MVEAIHSEGASHLKYHFEKIVKIPNEKMFFSHAPRTTDLEEMIQDSRPTIHRLLDEALEARTWPFETLDTFWTVHQPPTPYSETEEDEPPKKNFPTYKSNTQFTGMVVAKELYILLTQDVEFKKEYITLDLIIDWCKEKSIKWKNGDTTKQITVNFYNHVRRPRAYQIMDRSIPLMAEEPENVKKISAMTEGELGRCFGTFNYTHMTVDHAIDRIGRKKAAGATGEDRIVTKTRRSINL